MWLTEVISNHADFFSHSPWYFIFKRCQRPCLFYSGNPWIVNMLLVVLFVCRDNEWGASGFILFLRLELGPKDLHLVETNRIVEMKESSVSLQVTGCHGWWGLTPCLRMLFAWFFSALKHLAMPTSAAGWMQMLCTAQLPSSSAVGVGTHLWVWALILPLYLHSRYLHQVCSDNRTRPRAEQEIQLLHFLFTQLIWKGRVAFIPRN